MMYTTKATPLVAILAGILARACPSAAFAPNQHAVSPLRRIGSGASRTVPSQGGFLDNVSSGPVITKGKGAVVSLELSPSYDSFSSYAASIAAEPWYEAPWAIGLVFTIILFLGIFNADDVYVGKADDVNGGFCVTGYDPAGRYTEGDVIVKDSHELAGLADAILLVPAIGIPLAYKWAGVDIPSIGELDYEYNEFIVANAVFLIGFHGFLHYFSLSSNYIPPEDSEGIINGGGDTVDTDLLFDILSNDDNGLLFDILSYAITFATVQGYSSLPDLFGGEHGLLVSVVFTAVIGTLISKLTREASEIIGNPISVFFGITQLLVTGIATFFPNDQADPLMGWLFAVTCGVALVEFFDNGTESKFRNIGGHVWYDVALHAAVLSGYWVGGPANLLEQLFGGGV